MHAKQKCKNIIKLMWPSSNKTHRGLVSHPEKGLMNRFLNSRQREQKQTCAFVLLPLFSLRVLCVGDRDLYFLCVQPKRLSDECLQDTETINTSKSGFGSGRFGVGSFFSVLVVTLKGKALLNLCKVTFGSPHFWGCARPEPLKRQARPREHPTARGALAALKIPRS